MNKKHLSLLFFCLILFVPTLSFAHVGHPENYDDANNTPKNSKHQYDTLIQELWNQNYLGEGVNIAVIDSGVGLPKDDPNFQHPEFTKTITTLGCPIGKNLFFSDDSDVNSCTADKDYHDSDVSADPYGHGTLVAGILSATHDNDYESGNHLDGIAPNANLYSLRVTHEVNGEIKPTPDSVESALRWVLKTWENTDETDNIHIVNMSLRLDKSYDDINILIEKLYDEYGVLIVTSGGNVDERYDSNTVYPANHEKVIAVSNVAENNDSYELFTTSLSGSWISITAPGTDIYSTIPFFNNNWYYTTTGTSFSAPMVAGVAALLKQKYPELQANEIKRILLRMTQPMNGTNETGTVNCKNKDNITQMTCKTNEYGYGLLQAEVGETFKENVYMENSTYEIYNLPAETFKTSNIINGNKEFQMIRKYVNPDTKETYYETKTEFGYRWIKKEVGTPVKAKRLWIDNENIPTRIYPSEHESVRQNGTLNFNDAYPIEKEYTNPDTNEKWYEVKIEEGKYGWVKETSNTLVKPYTFSLMRDTNYFCPKEYYDFQSQCTADYFGTFTMKDYYYDSINRLHYFQAGEILNPSYVRQEDYADRWVTPRYFYNMLKNEFAVYSPKDQTLNLYNHPQDTEIAGTITLKSSEMLIADNTSYGPIYGYYFRVKTPIGWKWIVIDQNIHTFGIGEYGDYEDNRLIYGDDQKIF